MVTVLCLCADERLFCRISRPTRRYLGGKPAVLATVIAEYGAGRLDRHSGRLKSEATHNKLPLATDQELFSDHIKDPLP